MSKSVETVSLNILGKEYKIACPKDEQQALIKSGTLLDMQMRKIRDTGKVSGADRIAVLAALNLSNESSASSSANNFSSSDICSRLSDLRRKIENVLENS